MSKDVTHRLQEIAAWVEEQSRETARIRWQASMLIDAQHRRFDDRQRLAVRYRTVAQLTPDPGAAGEEMRGVAGDPQVVPSGDIVDQVRTLLRETDARDREYWSDEDAQIVYHLLEVWAAAARRGYTVQDVRMILQSFEPPA